MHIEWNRVTWYSKLIAVLAFLITAGLFFKLGVMYGSATTMINSFLQQNINNKSPSIATSASSTIASSTTTVLPPPTFVMITLSDGSTTTIPQNVQQSHDSSAGIITALSRCTEGSSTAATSTIYISVVNSTGYAGTSIFFDANGNNLGSESGGDRGPLPKPPVDVSGYNCVILEK